MNFKSIIILILATTGFVRSAAQPLEELLQTAVAGNFEIKALENDYKAALEKAPQVSQLPDPEINAALFVLPPETRLGPQRVALGASQMFPWKGTLEARASLALSQAGVKFQQIDAAKLEVLYQVKAAYFQLYELTQYKHIIENNLPLYKSLESLTLMKTENGQADIGDVLRVQLKIRELEQQLAMIEIQKRKATANLNEAIGRPVDMDVKMTSSLSKATMPFDKNALLDKVRLSHPMMKMYTSQQSSAQKAIELNDLNGKPTFGIGLDYIMVGEREDLNPEGNGQDILVPKIKIQIPLYRQKYTSKKQEEQLKIAALENRKSDTQLAFSSMIEQAYADFEDADLKLSLYQLQKQTLKSIITIKTEKYSQSGNSFDELLRLENDLLEYDLKIVKAITQGHLARAKIERLTPLN